MSNSRDAFRLFEYQPFQVFVISALACEELRKIYTCYGIENNKEWRIVVLLHEYGRMSMSQLVQESFINSVNVTRSVESLFQKKLCERYYDQEDRRRVEVELSKEGYQLMEELIPDLKVFEETFKKLSNGFSVEIQKNYKTIFKFFTESHHPKIN